MLKKANYNEFKYKNSELPYTGYYIQIKGRYYAGKSFVANKSKQIVKIQKDPSQQLGIYPYALIHKEFITTIQQPKLQLIKHPRKFSTLQQFVTIYILQRKRDGKLYEVTKNCYNKLSSKSNPVYNYFSLILKISGQPYQKTLFNNKSLFSINHYNVVQFVKKLYFV